MASTVLPLRPTGIRASSFSASNRKSDSHRPKSQSSSNNKWWTPLFGWSSNPDYIDGGSNDSSTARSSDADLQAPNSRSRFAPGGFTEEKAKQLRARTLETSTFHDIMYHSAIASRLASDVSNMSDR